MPSATITINGIAGSNTNVTAGATINLSNQDSGGEITYNWTILDQPPGVLDVLSATNIKSPTLTCRKEGSYLLKLVVNQSLPSQLSNTAVAAVRQVKTVLRVPAAGEILEVDAIRGWATDVNNYLIGIDGILAQPGIIVGTAGQAGLGQGNILTASSDATLKSGLPGQEIVPSFTLATATSVANTSGTLFVLETGVDGNPTPANGALIKAKFLGRFSQFVTGVGAVSGQNVYIDNTGNLSLTPGTNVRVVGHVLTAPGGITFDLFFDGAGGAAAPLLAPYLVNGAVPQLPNSINVQAIATNLTFQPANGVNIPLTIKQFVGGLQNLLQFQDNTATLLTFVDDLGNIRFNSVAQQNILSTSAPFDLGTATANTQPVNILINGTSKWSFDQFGNLQAVLGASQAITNTTGALTISSTTGAMTLGPTDAHTLTLQTAATAWWVLGTTGNLTAATAGAQTISKTGGAFSISSAGGVFTIGPTDVNTLTLQTNSIAWWVMDSTGNLVGAQASAQIISKTNGAFTVRGSGGSMTVGTTDANTLALQTGGTAWWVIDTTGDLTASTAGTQQIEKTGGAFNITGAGGAMVVGTTDANTLTLETGGTAWWVVGTTGNLTATTAGTQVISKTNGALTIGTTDANVLGFQSGGTKWWDLNNAGTLSASQASTRVIQQLNGAFTIISTGGVMGVGTSDTSNVSFFVGGSGSTNAFNIQGTAALVNVGDISLEQNNDQNIVKKNGNLQVRTFGANTLGFGTNNTQHWQIAAVNAGNQNIGDLVSTGARKIKAVGDPVDATDAANREFVETNGLIHPILLSNNSLNTTATNSSVAILTMSYTVPSSLTSNTVLYGLAVVSAKATGGTPADCTLTVTFNGAATTNASTSSVSNGNHFATIVHQVTSSGSFAPGTVVSIVITATVTGTWQFNTASDGAHQSIKMLVFSNNSLNIGG